MYTLRALFVLVCAFFLSLPAKALPRKVNLGSPASYSPAATIDFPQPASPAYAGTSVTLAALSSNGMPVTYSVVSGPGAVIGSTLTYIGVGAVVVEANQSAGVDPPTPVRNTITSVLLNEPLTSPSAPVATVVTFLQGGTVNTMRAASQGADNLDFVVVPGGTCAVGKTYASGDTCTASFIFTPRRPGLRFGGIVLNDGKGDLLANSYIVGVGTGPQILYNPPNQINVGSGFGGLAGVAVDGSGNVYGADIVGGGIYQVSVATGATRQIASTPGTTDVSVDGSGNVFYGDRQKVYEILAVNGVIPIKPTIRTLVDGFISIDGLKVDAFGNVYIAEGGNPADTSTSSIAELQAVNGTIPSPVTVRVIASAVGSPTGVAVDISGNVFFSDETNHSLQKIQASNGVIPTPAIITTVSDAFTVPTNVTIDVSGNVYVPDLGTHDVRELIAVNGVLPDNPTIISRGQNLFRPEGATVDASGNLYVADDTLGSVVELAYGAPPTITFAATVIGQTSSDSPKTVSIMNGGNADLMLPRPMSGTNPSIAPQSFTVDASSSCPVLTPGSSPGTLAQGGTCSTAINFVPSVQGPIQGQLVSIDNNQGIVNSTQTILLNAVGLGIPPTIKFFVADHTFGDPPFTVAATSNSAGAFTYSVVSGPATIAGSTVTLTGAGIVVLRASQAADGNYSEGQQDAAFQVNKEAQTITFAPPPSPVPYNIGTIQLQATATSGLPVSFSVISGPAQVSGNTLTIQGGGIVIVAADQPGNANLLPAPQVRQTIVVNFGVAVAILTGTPTPVFLTNPVQLSALVTGGGGSPSGVVRFVEGNSTIGSAAIVGSTATLVTTTLTLGTHTITAVYVGDANFASVHSSNVSVLVEDFSLALSNPTVAISHGGIATYSFLVSPIGGARMPSDIHFTMRGGPQYATSAFSPQVITAGSGSGTVTLSVQTPNFPAGQASSSALSGNGVRLALLSFGAFTLGFWHKRKRIARGWSLGLILLLAGAACSTLTGCGSGWRTQFWTLSVTASSGNLTHTAAATLTSHCQDGHDACSVQ